ncbi:MAG: glyoxalase [Microbacterium sp. 14-71-5]|jgi:predicted enzyme related to lactoylglutathione lyase|uniref:VOC family protein n=1 Tax=Microbacterium sp. 13-71-7 TaxID=1970399 RepID=UPI000BCC3F6B|nr:VOC family protein [Microbacterium sp. 13-71-7]OZB85729.1 MAG: glyoxalase [Microbacterium sp. 13-71-7]OZB86540.1 MAG: glyoxalase [Microbacterium sp. 14-71-5]
MDIMINASFLPHTDAEESLRFYRDVLGWELRKDVGYQQMRWLTVGPANQPDTSIVLTPPAVDPGINDDERRTILELMAKGSFGGIVLATENVDAAFAEIEARGADVVQEPIDQPYGIRDCAFRDPAGNMIRLQQVA